jgi:4-amino-4-deoxy-L-arabinose transferase-like glycosyltransferase
MAPPREETYRQMLGYKEVSSVRSRENQAVEQSSVEGRGSAPGTTERGLASRIFSWRFWPVLLVVLVPTLALWRLGGSTVLDWDEAETGQVAFEMVRTGNYLSYRSERQPEPAFAKPPLAVWCITASYRILGFNEFALRLPSALAAMLVVLAAYRTVRLYAPRSAAVIACLILVSSRGLFGHHVGRTGDTDALLIAGQAGFVFFLLRYLDGGGRARDIVVAGMCTAGAFWTKGLASLPLPAGAVLYAVVTHRGRHLVRRTEAWLGLGVFAASVVGWFFLAPAMGPPFSVVHDVITRVFFDVEGHGATWLPFFVLGAIVSLFTPWAYVLGLALLPVAVRRFRHPGEAWRELFDDSNRLMLVSFCVMLPLIVLLVVMRSKLTWYAAPLVPYLSIVFAAGLETLRSRYRFAAPAFVVLLTAAFAYQLMRLSTPVRDPVCSAMKRASPTLAAAGLVVADPALAPRHRLTLSWTLAKLGPVAATGACVAVAREAVVVGQTPFVGQFGECERIAAVGEFTICRLH